MRSEIIPAFFIRILAPFSLALLIGCSGKPGKPAQEAAAGPSSVTAISPQRKSLRRVVEQPGTIRPYEQTVLFAKVPGYVARIHGDIGDRIKGPKRDARGQEIEPGQILAELSDPELVEEARQKASLVLQAEAEAAQARKALAAALANVKAVEATVLEAEAGMTRAQANHDRWASEARRVTELVKNKVIDVQTRDETDNQFRAAEAARNEARARVASAQAMVMKSRADQENVEASVRSAEARVEVARAEARRLQALLGYTRIHAPYDGVIVRRTVNTGELVAASDSERKGIFTVVRDDPVRVVVEVPEGDAGLVENQGEVSLTIQALGGSPIPAKVSRTSWSLEPASRTLRTEIDLPNKERRLRPGMYVYARLTGHLPETWVVPTSALVKQGDAWVCFLIEGDRVVRTPVQVGRSDAGLIQVLKREQPGTPITWVPWTGKEVLAEKALGLVDGQSVQILAGGK